MAGGSLTEFIQRMERKALVQRLIDCLPVSREPEVSAEPENYPGLRAAWQERRSKEGNYPEVSVFVTRSHKLRARVTETKGGIPYEVTIGGQKWDTLDPAVQDAILRAEWPDGGTPVDPGDILPLKEEKA